MKSYTIITCRIQKKLAQTNAKIEKMELDKKIKEDLKTVALGTSKINYLDPRISVAWCKRHEVPIEKVMSLFVNDLCSLLLYVPVNNLFLVIYYGTNRFLLIFHCSFPNERN